MNNKIIILLGLLLSFASCSLLWEDLDVENENAPDLDDVYSNPEEYPALLTGAYRVWWNSAIGQNPALALGVGAEQICSGYGSWGMRTFNTIPRVPIDNREGDIVIQPEAGGWYGFYPVVGTVNNIIKKIEHEGVEVIINGEDRTAMVLANAYFLQGTAYGHLGLLYDQAFLITDVDIPADFEYVFTPYKSIMEFALERIDRAIEIAETNTFQAEQMMPGVNMSNEYLGKVANSTAARMLVAASRTPQEDSSIDWARVKRYAEKGIDTNFFVYAQVGWQGLAANIRDTTNPLHIMEWDWVRVSQRVISLMAPNDPIGTYPRPEGVHEYPEAENPVDHRLLTDMTYAGQHGNWNPASLGFHILGEYKYTRYRESFSVPGVGNIDFLLKAENDLLLAEAEIRTGGDLQKAASLINNTRVERGKMSAMTGGNSSSELLDAVMHERYVELIATFMPLTYFDRRRTGTLIDGTAWHFPIPAQELTIHKLPIYTFGGKGNEM
ncbi:RagB/SusD family nutrient uptake outer membrane protein [Aureibacter tunicatorum]|uniref:RagB/SusD family nutrient uptake outer membrane protein n=1 Tax=Aureibacter tunicatorum TaxID=866807 RepID=A0AAE3XPG0_9BACT|nr:RagB/SusD family nutrient uptake outer membrane protein [Aureibacter tunicatorum]MDR6240288.1 hypothetical protein [Aureibacter tunicatorum]BDD05831.1 hypothetical protein AUTU_33140 [Aureibacter tunicatorum]